MCLLQTSRPCLDGRQSFYKNVCSSGSGAGLARCRRSPPSLSRRIQVGSHYPRISTLPSLYNDNMEDRRSGGWSWRRLLENSGTIPSRHLKLVTGHFSFQMLLPFTTELVNMSLRDGPDGCLKAQVWLSLLAARYADTAAASYLVSQHRLGAVSAHWSHMCKCQHFANHVCYKLRKEMLQWCSNQDYKHVGFVLQYINARLAPHTGVSGPSWPKVIKNFSRKVSGGGRKGVCRKGPENRQTCLKLPNVGTKRHF